MFRAPCPSDQSFPELGTCRARVRWRERNVFAESLRRRAGRAAVELLRGTARPRTEPPAAHHVFARVFKDVYPRYKTMSGYLVERKSALGLPRAAGGDRRRT